MSPVWCFYAHHISTFEREHKMRNANTAKYFFYVFALLAILAAV